MLSTAIPKATPNTFCTYKEVATHRLGQQQVERVVFLLAGNRRRSPPDTRTPR